MTSIFRSKTKAATEDEVDPLDALAASRIEAAKRLTNAVGAAGTAMRDLLKAEREFNAEVNASRGSSGDGAMRFAQQLYPFLVAEMNLGAPEMAKFLRLPHVAPSRCESIANMVERLAASDLVSLQSKGEAV